jgi:hypothetical protein
MDPRLFEGEVSGHDLLIDPSVILGEKFEFAIAKPIGPGISDMGHRRDAAL